MLLEQFKQVKVFAFDMDGVLTDGTLYVMAGGEMVRRMHIKDGYALQLAVKRGYRVVVISGSYSAPVLERLAGLGVTDVFMRVKNKKAILEEYLKRHSLSLADTLFMGDDMPDIKVMKAVFLPCAPRDAAPAVKEVSRYISKLDGGTGCVRDVIEMTLKLNGHWDEDTDIASI